MATLALGVATAACAGQSARGSVASPPSGADAARDARERAPTPRAEPATAADRITQAEEALSAQRPARAVALFSRALAATDANTPVDLVGRAYLGLARAHERLGDCSSAIRAYTSYETRLGRTERAVEVTMHRGACEAELQRWSRSAQSYAAAHELIAASSDGALPSVEVEILARRGFALFQLERFDDALTALEAADAVFEAAEATDAERFDTYYFVGMARFYRAAVWHRRFRDVEIGASKREMKADFERKLELLTKAQDAYNRTIRAKHVFWVSASGYQLGSLFEEFYDALMYAPVPAWLTEAQREVYYEELKKQLRPVVNKAIWVFEKNLETARRLGYENPFIEKTEAQLARLQGVLLAGDSGLGQPHPRLAPAEARPDPGPDAGTGDAYAVHAPTAGHGSGSQGDPDDDASASAGFESIADRKLFVPAKTPL